MEKSRNKVVQRIGLQQVVSHKVNEREIRETFLRATLGGKKEKWQYFLDVVGRGLSPQEEVTILSMEIIFLSSFQEWVELDLSCFHYEPSIHFDFLASMLVLLCRIQLPRSVLCSTLVYFSCQYSQMCGGVHSSWSRWNGELE